MCKKHCPAKTKTVKKEGSKLEREHMSEETRGNPKKKGGRQKPHSFCQRAKLFAVTQKNEKRDKRSVRGTKLPCIVVLSLVLCLSPNTKEETALSQMEEK